MKKFEFIINEGLFIHERNDAVAPFDVRVTKRYETELLSSPDMMERDSMSYEYEIIAVTLGGKELSPRRVKKLRGINYNALWPEIIDADLERFSKKMLELRLQQTASEAPVEHRICVESPGLYHIENGVVYVFGDQIYKYNLSDGIHIESSEKLKKLSCLKSEIMLKTDLSMDDSYIKAAPNCSIIVVYSVLLAVIKPFLVEAGFNPSVCLNIYGRPGIGKTRIAKTLGRLTEKPELFWGSAVNGTKDKIMKKLREAYGGVFILDDYHPTATSYKQNRQLDLMDETMREIESDPKTAVLIMTSERLEGGYSMQDRMLQIELECVDDKALNAIESMPRYLPTMAMNFVNCLAENYDKVIHDITAEYASYKKEGTCTRMERQGRDLLIAAKLYSKYITEKSGMEELKMALNVQCQKQIRHMQKMCEAENIENYVLLFYHLVNDESIYRICISKRDGYNAAINEIFLQEGQKLWITKVALEYGIQEKYECRPEEICKQIKKALHENDLLVEDKDVSTRKFMGMRHLCISYLALKNYVKVHGTNQRLHAKEEE